MVDLSGQQFGIYRVMLLLATGGFGAAYLGEQVQSKNQVFITTLSAGAERRERQRFINQARLLAKASHLHVMSILDFGEQDGLSFLITDNAPSGSLRQRHPPGSRVSLKSVVSYVKQVASALHSVHDQGIVHRDVKPEHLLVGGFALHFCAKQPW